MAEISRFFNGPSYTAGEFAEYFSRFLTDGVYVQDGNIDLKVNAGSGMSVNVDKGYAFIKGYMYKNDAILNKVISNADVTLDRIDRVVLKFDEANKAIGVEVKQGSLASSPVAPTLQNTDTLKEISLAQVRIRKNATTINQSDITDERMSEFGGVVSSLITIPVNDLWTNWNSNMSTIQGEWDAWYQEATGSAISPDLISQNATHRFITDILLAKLNGIEAEANKYIHPTGTTSTNPHGTTKADVWLDLVDNTQQMPIKGSTFTGIAKGQSNTSYTTSQLRNIILSPSNPSGGSNGDIWIKYV